MTPEEFTRLRKKLGLTQAALAQAFECSERFIAYRESGKRRIKGMLAYAIKGITQERNDE